MSRDPTPSPALVAPPEREEGPVDAARASHKSYRRKYRKTMVKFEETMRESTALVKEEQRILDIARRLTEQNDQILQLLSDLNSSPQIPPSIRYDLSSTPSKLLTTDPDQAQQRSEAKKRLSDCRERLRRGSVDLVEYHELQTAIAGGPAFQAKRPYSTLLKTSHTHVRPHRELPPDNAATPSTGYLSVREQDQYLEGLDSFLDKKSITPRPYALFSSGPQSIEQGVEREKELQLRNPISVYNWLRKHQPQVFLQDNEANSEKSARPAGIRSSKRASTTGNPAVKQERELYDDEGIALEASMSNRGKRKREDDPGYRPKGGASRASKRRREDGGPSNRRSKKSSISTL